MQDWLLIANTKSRRMKTKTMDEDTRMEYIRRIQEGMRALSNDEIAALQEKWQAGMYNQQSSEQRQSEGLRNFWRNEYVQVDDPKQKTLWQRICNLFK